MTKHPNMAIIIDILNHLGHQVFNGWCALQEAKYLQLAYQQGKIKKPTWLFPIIYDASIESAFSSLLRITLSNNSSANWESLLNYASSFAGDFPDPAKDEVLNQVSQYRTEAAQLEPLMAKVKLHHDKGLTPYDTEKGYAPPSIDFVEMEKLFSFYIRMVNTFSDYATSSELFLGHLEKRISDETEYLLRLLEQAD